jgi:hypothetical protein
MVSQRGVLNLAHSDAQRDAYARRGNAMRLNGVDAELLTASANRKRLIRSSISTAHASRSRAADAEARGGTARHDAVAWGYARGADRRGVDIIQNCEVTGFDCAMATASVGVRPRAATIRAKKVGLAVAGSTGAHAMAGLRAADREPCAAGLRLRIAEAADRPSSPSAPAISTSASRTRAASSSAAISTATTPTPSAAICLSSRMMARWRHGADAGPRPRAHAALTGAASWTCRWTARRSSTAPDRRALSQCRLVLWRLQGDAGLRLVLRPSARARRTASTGAAFTLDRFAPVW